MYNCPNCNQPTDDNGHCMNIDCSCAHEQANRNAARQTAKAAAGHATFEPRAFSSSGRVD